jgi:hypothetical protein
MSMHIHTVRRIGLGAIGLSVAVILFRWAYAPGPRDIEVAPVVGQVTSANHPAGGGMLVFFEPLERGHLFASGRVLPDGSFRHVYTNGCLDYEGVMPGKYRVFLHPLSSAQPGPSIDPKYLGPGTSDLVVDVERDWNDITLALH